MKRVYIEITNICNLNCSFCHGTSRAPGMMTEEEFDYISDCFIGKADTMFFHVMGEPLLHPQLQNFIKKASNKGFKPCVTTNGTLLKQRSAEILEAKPYKVSISLHSREANGLDNLDEYLSECTDFAKSLAETGGFCALRLWNRGGENKQNDIIMSTLKAQFAEPWVKTRSGFRMADRIFLEEDEKFDWPDPDAKNYGSQMFCYGLRDQIAVLADGTVVPCCLDADGNIPLGNIFESSIEEIMSTERAKNLYDGFTKHTATEDLCRHCGYAAAKAFRT